MRDVLGISAAIVIALLSQIVEPWSRPWWAGMILAGIIAVWAGGDLIYRAAHSRGTGVKMSTWGPWILIVGGPLLGLAWLYLIHSQGGTQESPSTVARLAELGWTVKPGQNDVLFEVVDRSLPPMKESASYFAQLHKPFRLHFQQVNGLEGLHYLADMKDCAKIEINAGEFTDISELRGFGYLTSLIISQVPLNGVGIVDPAALSSLPNLEELNLNHTRIRSADFLASLTKLKTLNLGQTLISDISPISGLNLLENLEIRDTRVTDLRPLDQNKNLKGTSNNSWFWRFCLS